MSKINKVKCQMSKINKVKSQMSKSNIGQMSNVNKVNFDGAYLRSSSGNFFSTRIVELALWRRHHIRSIWQNCTILLSPLLLFDGMIIRYISLKYKSFKRNLLTFMFSISQICTTHSLFNFQNPIVLSYQNSPS